VERSQIHHILDSLAGCCLFPLSFLHSDTVEISVACNA